MTTKTLRLPASLTRAIREVGHSEHVEESTAMRKLIQLGYERYLANQYRAGFISLRHVAEKMEVTQSEAIDRLRLLGVTGNVSADDTLQSLKSLAR
jgi:hypothetical protein